MVDADKVYFALTDEGADVAHRVYRPILDDRRLDDELEGLRLLKAELSVFRWKARDERSHARDDR